MITFIIVSPSFFPAVTSFRIPRTADHVLANTAGASTSKHRPRPQTHAGGPPLWCPFPPLVCLGPSNALGNVPATALPAAQFADWCRPAMSSRESQSQKPRLLLQLADVVNSRSNIQKRVNKKKACSNSDLWTCYKLNAAQINNWVLTTNHDRITKQESSMLLASVWVCFIYHMSALKNEKQRPSLLKVPKFLPSFQLCNATPSTTVLRRWFTLWAALDRLLAWLKHVYSTWSTTLWSSQVHPVSTGDILNLMSLTGKWTELEDSKWRKGRKWTKVDSAQVVFSSLGFHDTLPGFFLLSLKSARHRL